jgi:hypothetical protein
MGRYRYRTMPQEYLAARDAYTDQYDHFVKDVQRKTKCVDDTLLLSNTVEEAGHQVCDYLALCASN